MGVTFVHAEADSTLTSGDPDQIEPSIIAQLNVCVIF